MNSSRGQNLFSFCVPALCVSAYWGGDDFKRPFFFISKNILLLICIGEMFSLESAVLCPKTIDICDRLILGRMEHF